MIVVLLSRRISQRQLDVLAVNASTPTSSTQSSIAVGIYTWSSRQHIRRSFRIAVRQLTLGDISQPINLRSGRRLSSTERRYLSHDESMLLGAPNCLRMNTQAFWWTFSLVRVFKYGSISLSMLWKERDAPEASLGSSWRRERS